MHRLYTYAAGFFLLLGLLVLAACSGSKEAEGPQPETTVIAQNDNPLDVTLYVARGTQRIRLGVVSSGDRQAYVIPEIILNGPTHLQFLADPIGSPHTFLVDEVFMVPGDEFYLSISGALR